MSRKIQKAFNRVIEILGSEAELARKLGVSRQLINKWNIFRIKPEHVVAIEKLTKSKVKREELRPDLYN